MLPPVFSVHNRRCGGLFPLPTIRRAQGDTVTRTSCMRGRYETEQPSIWEIEFEHQILPPKTCPSTVVLDISYSIWRYFELSGMICTTYISDFNKFAPLHGHVSLHTSVDYLIAVVLVLVQRNALKSTRYARRTDRNLSYRPSSHRLWLDVHTKVGVSGTHKNSVLLWSIRHQELSL